MSKHGTRPAYDWHGALVLAATVTAGLAAWLLLAGVWHLILFTIRLLTQ